MDACVSIRSLRWLKRSAANPLQGSNSNCGANCRPVTMPTAVASWCVSCVSTIQSCATRCIQVPMLDTMPPAVHTRKLKFPRARNAPASGFLMGAPGCCLRETHRNALLTAG